MPCDRSGILVIIAVLLIVERNVIAVLRRATAACKLCNIRIAQTSVLLHELLTLFRITLDVLGELFDLAIILSDLFRIECYGNHLTFIFVISHIP